MIVARLHSVERNGRRYLAGSLTTSYTFRAGVRVVLLKRGDCYELCELGPRDTRRPTPESLSAFLDAEDITETDAS